jgi:hydroxymethylglutaryl-CoA synthase
MEVYDFYKPNHSEYAVVDGRLSQWAYLFSLDKCYERYKEKYARRYRNSSAPVTVDHFDYFVMHSPVRAHVRECMLSMYMNAHCSMLVCVPF